MLINMNIEESPRPGVFYCHVDNICLVIEGGQIVGWYRPNLSEVV